MPILSVDQVLKFVKEFGLSVIIMAVGLWYMSQLVETQRIESTENKTYIRGKLEVMNSATNSVLEKASIIIQANTIARDDQINIDKIISESITRQENTLTSIDNTMREASKSAKISQDYLQIFTETVSQEHKEQMSKAKEILEEVNR